MHDFCLTNDAVIFKENIDILLQEIDTLFDTSKGDIFGSPEHSTDFERFLWNENISTTTISEYVKNTIMNKCDTFDFTINVETTAHFGTYSDIILVNIDIHNKDYRAQRSYKIG